MVRNPFIAIFFLCIAIHMVSPEEVLFYVLEDTPAWIRVNFPPPLTYDNADIIIPAGSIVSNVSRPSPFFEINGNLNVGHNSITFGNEQYSIAANTFVPINTEEIFHESFLRSADPHAKIWVTSYFLEAFSYENIDVLMPHEQRIVEAAQRDSFMRWFDVSAFDESLVITQSTISIGGLSQDQFWIQRIESIPNGYRVAVTWNVSSALDWRLNFRSARVNLPDCDTTPVFDLYFILDGDYLDVYYSTGTGDSSRTFSASFALIDSVMREQLFSSISMGQWQTEFDMSKIVFWPRRADGTMDFPPPGVDVSGFETSHTTTARLRIRDNPATDSPIVTTLDLGAEVQVLETGPAATIGEVTAPWVRLLAANGFTGWAFSGFLESTAAPAEPVIHDPPEPVAATPAEPPAPVPPNDAASAPMPLWLPLAIVGAAVVVIGSAVLFAIRRKRGLRP